jgi:hypothetical protein
MLCGDIGGVGAEDDRMVKVGVANINNATIDIFEFKSNHIQYYYGAKSVYCVSDDY